VYCLLAEAYAAVACIASAPVMTMQAATAAAAAAADLCAAAEGVAVS